MMDSWGGGRESGTITSSTSPYLLVKPSGFWVL